MDSNKKDWGKDAHASEQRVLEKRKGETQDKKEDCNRN